MNSCARVSFFVEIHPHVPFIGVTVKRAKTIKNNSEMHLLKISKLKNHYRWKLGLEIFEKALKSAHK